jgi:hypothetical protein
VLEYPIYLPACGSSVGIAGTTLLARTTFGWYRLRDQ